MHMQQSMYLGRWYKDGDAICRQGELGDCMYVIQEGKVRLMSRSGTSEYCLGELQTGEFWGEGGLFEKDYARNSTARAIGDVCILSIEKRMFMSRINEDPSFVLKILRKMSRRITELEAALVRGSEAQAQKAATTTGGRT
jgi:CRP-like cAMP-binding protein